MPRIKARSISLMSIIDTQRRRLAAGTMADVKAPVKQPSTIRRLRRRRIVRSRTVNNKVGNSLRVITVATSSSNSNLWVGVNSSLLLWVNGEVRPRQASTIKVRDKVGWEVRRPHNKVGEDQDTVDQVMVDKGMEGRLPVPPEDMATIPTTSRPVNGKNE